MQALTSAWKSLPDGVPLLGLVDNPLMRPGTPACVEQKGLGAGEACAVPRATALPARSMQRAVESFPQAHLIDLTDLYCEPDVCRPVVGNVVVYRDRAHLTAAYAKTLAPYLGERLARAIG